MLRFAGNEDKNRTNLAKHGISFVTAAKAFDDPRAFSSPERVVEGEQRWKNHPMGGGRSCNSIGCAHGRRRRRGGSHTHHFGAKGDGKGKESL
jgi:uncharacterized DUF497 family protein